MNNLPEDLRGRVALIMNRLSNQSSIGRSKSISDVMTLLKQVTAEGYKQGVSDALFSPDEHSTSETSARNTRLARMHGEAR